MINRRPKSDEVLSRKEQVENKGTSHKSSYNNHRWNSIE